MHKTDTLKEKVARACFEYLLKSVNANATQSSGEIWLGIGSGTTIKFFLSILSSKFLDGSLPFTFVTVSSSIDSEMTCRSLGLPIKQVEDLTDNRKLDYYIDGADEVDSHKRCLKGLGGASTREKLLRLVSDQFFVLIDETKKVLSLCEKDPIVVEILPFAYQKTIESIKSLNPVPSKVLIRKGSGKMGYILTDNHNYLADVYFEKPFSPDFELSILEQQIKLVSGVVETGLFSTPATVVFIASEDRVDIIE